MYWMSNIFLLRVARKRCESSQMWWPFQAPVHSLTKQSPVLPVCLGSSSLIELSTCYSLNPGYVGPPGSSAFLSPYNHVILCLIFPVFAILDNLPKISFLTSWTYWHHRSLSQSQSCFLWEALPDCISQWYILLSMNFCDSVSDPYTRLFIFVRICMSYSPD